MKRRSILFAVLTFVAAVMVMGQAALFAQPGGGQRGGGQRGGFDMEAMRARMMERYQEQLGMGDEEWKAVEPLVTKLMEKQQSEREFSARGFMFMRRGGADAPEQPKVVEELTKALEDDETPADEIKTKLEALRKARKEAQEAVKKAQDELRSVLTVRQEAQLVLSGMLD